MLVVYLLTESLNNYPNLSSLIHEKISNKSYIN